MGIASRKGLHRVGRGRRDTPCAVSAVARKTSGLGFSAWEVSNGPCLVVLFILVAGFPESQIRFGSVSFGCAADRCLRGCRCRINRWWVAFDQVALPWHGFDESAQNSFAELRSHRHAGDGRNAVARKPL